MRKHKQINEAGAQRQTLAEPHGQAVPEVRGRKQSEKQDTEKLCSNRAGKIRGKLFCLKTEIQKRPFQIHEQGGIIFFFIIRQIFVQHVKVSYIIQVLKINK